MSYDDRWVKLAHFFYLDPLIAALPDDSTELMFLRGLGYAGGSRSGGFIPDAVVATLSRSKQPQKCADALVACGLWLVMAGGYAIAKWDQWQSELTKLEERRRRDRERKRPKVEGVASGL